MAKSMQLDTLTGLINTAQYLASPNCDERPVGASINLLVIHGISLPPRIFGGTAIEDFFCNQLNPHDHPYFAEIADLKVSAHLLIRRTGKMIQFVPLNLRAWHAGQSSFLGRDNCNDFSIGIELEGTDDIPYTLDQYHTLAKTTLLLMQHFPISSKHIVGHSDIAPTRKTDPGYIFDWSYYRQLLGKEVCV